jgi:hypothetical protein
MPGIKESATDTVPSPFMNRSSWLTLWRRLRYLIPPPFRTEIVARIEEEQKLVDANKKLIELFEEKIKEKIAEVWG